MYVDNVSWAIELTQCYGQSNLTLCNEYPSNMTISDVLFKNFSGVTSTAKEPYVATLVCSSSTVCITCLMIHRTLVLMVLMLDFHRYARTYTLKTLMLSARRAPTKQCAQMYVLLSSLVHSEAILIREYRSMTPYFNSTAHHSGVTNSSNL